MGATSLSTQQCKASRARWARMASVMMGSWVMTPSLLDDDALLAGVAQDAAAGVGQDELDGHTLAFLEVVGGLGIAHFYRDVERKGRRQDFKAELVASQGPISPMTVISLFR